MRHPTRAAATAPPFLVLLVALAAGATGASPGPALAQEGAVSGVEPREGQRIVLVTGSTGGLGREVALALGRSGDHVIIHGRNVARGTEVAETINADGPGTARFYRADLADYDRIRSLVAAVKADYGHIDVLVNNAGVAFIGDDTRYTSDDGYELHFQINYLAHWLLTDQLLPLVRAAAERGHDARIVHVSSLSRAPLDFDDLMLEEGYSTMRAYGQSKLAQVMHTMELARELEGTGIRVNALHPATVMDTGMILEAGLEPRSSVEEGRDNVLQLINGDVGSGDYYVDGAVVDAPHPQAYDAGARARLMRVSRELTSAGGG